MSNKRLRVRNRNRNRMGTKRLERNRLRRLWSGEQLEIRAAPGSMLTEILALTGNPIALVQAANQIAATDPISPVIRGIQNQAVVQSDTPPMQRTDNAEIVPEKSDKAGHPAPRSKQPDQTKQAVEGHRSPANTSQLSRDAKQNDSPASLLFTESDRDHPQRTR